MNKTIITVAVVALAVVAVLYLARPAPVKAATTASTNTLYGAAIAGVMSLGQLLNAPTKEPSLTSSANKATDAVANGLPVSATQGNTLMTPDWLDGSSYVSAGEPNNPGDPEYA